MLDSIKQPAAETYVSDYAKYPFLLRISNGEQETVLLSEASISRLDVRGHGDASLTRINVTEWQDAIDKLFARPAPTEIEGETEYAMDTVQGEMPDPSGAANRDRLVFLARKYAGFSSREDNARLEMLTEKVRSLMPRVSAADVDRLTSLVEDLRAVQERHKQLRERTGLD